MVRVHSMFTVVRRLAACMVLLGATIPLAGAQGDPNLGRQIYNSTNGAPAGFNCVNCHGTPPDERASRGADQPQLILNAINGGVAQMAILRPYVSPTDANHLAAYLANPNGAPTGSVTLSTTTLAFGNQQVMVASAPMTVTVTNSGANAVTLSSVVPGGANVADFALGGTCAANMVLAATQSCQVSVTFTPQAVGTRSALVSIVHSGANSPGVVNLSGNGTSGPTPSVALSGTAINFATPQTVGTTSAAQQVTLTNNGTAALTLNSLAVGGTHASDFARAGTCAAGATVAVGASCTISATFTPSAVGARSGTISIASNAPGSPHAIALSGTGQAVPVPIATLSATSLLFGNHVVGTTSPAQVLSLSNTGTATLNLGMVAITGAGFARTTNCGASLAPNASCSFNITFAPVAAGVVNGALSIPTNEPSGSPRTVTLAANGVAAGTVLPTVALAPATLTFAGQVVNTTSAVQSVTLTNSGTVGLTLTGFTITGANASEFVRGGTCAANATLQPNGSCTLTVTFTPTAAGARSATLYVLSNAQGQPSLPLAGTATAPVPAASLSATALAFGDQAVGTTSAVRTVTLNSNGSGPLPITSIVASGDYQVQSHTCGTSVAVGASCTINVTFRPSAAGARAGQLTITDGAAGSPRNVALTGNGTATAQPAAAGAAPAADGGGGGGCTIGSSGGSRGFDPVLALLAIAAFMGALRRRRATVRR